MMKKQVFEYILRVFAFIVLTGFLHEKISTSLIYAFESFFEFFYEKKPIFNFDINIELLFGIIIGLFSLFLAWIGVTYIFVKICGLFKKLDGLKKWQEFLVVVLIDVVFCIISGILDKHRTINISIRASFDFVSYTLIPSYLFYLFLNYLTKKFPRPFEKIGYYLSIEFFKDVFNKIKRLVQTKIH